MAQAVASPEGNLLRLARESHRPRKLAIREAARRAGLSESHWRHVESGYEPKGGMQIPVRAAGGTLARMAHIVGVAPDRLDEVGRSDAAEILREIERRDQSAPAAGDFLTPDDPEIFRAILADPGLDEHVKRGMIIWGREQIAENRAREAGEQAERKPA